MLMLPALPALSVLHAQHAAFRVKGRVVTERGEPIDKADVRLEAFYGYAAGTFAGPRKLSAQSNAKGEWNVGALQPGIWLFEVMAPGYIPETVVLPIRILTTVSMGTSGMALTWDLVLKPVRPSTDVKGELLTQAHLQRTPRDVRAMLSRLMQKSNGEVASATVSAPSQSATATADPINLDDAYLSGALQDFVEKNSGNIETVRSNAVPVINKVSAGYPKDFTDLAYPPQVADDYVGCPDVQDKDAFAARVHGDSMTPKYRPGDIVIFSPALSPKSGDDCFIRFEDGQTTFKRIFFENDETSTPVIRLQPRNEKYRAQVIPAEQITGLYKAVYKYQSVEE